MNLTSKQFRIMRYLDKCSMPQTPTEIGEGCGMQYYAASSWSNSGMKSLIKGGLVERSAAGPYYSITDLGRAALSEPRP